MKGWMYILKCRDGSYYTGSTKYLELRIAQHQNGEGSNHTKKRLPVELIYFEEYYRIDFAFYREKQVQGWSRKKKEALIAGMTEELHELARCLNETSHVGFGYAQPTNEIGSDQTTNESGSDQTTNESGYNQTTNESGSDQTTIDPGSNQTTIKLGSDQTTIELGSDQLAKEHSSNQLMD